MALSGYIIVIFKSLPLLIFKSLPLLCPWPERLAPLSRAPMPAIDCLFALGPGRNASHSRIAS